jgi:hypothetical protein
MSRDYPRNKAPAYSLPISSPKEELLVIARIHHKEAKQLFERSQQAQAEGLPEEAKLLLDLGIARRDKADELEKAAREEIVDPILAEILDSEPEMFKNYTSNTPTYSAPESELPQSWKDELKPRPLGPIARALAWIGSWIAE